MGSVGSSGKPKSPGGKLVTPRNKKKQRLSNIPSLERFGFKVTSSPQETTPSPNTNPFSLASGSKAKTKTKGQHMSTSTKTSPFAAASAKHTSGKSNGDSVKDDETTTTTTGATEQSEKRKTSKVEYILYFYNHYML